MRYVTTKEWSFDAASTNLTLWTPASGEQLAVTSAVATCANSNSVDVAVRIGFGSTGLTDLTQNSTAGVDGVFFSHGGIAKGGGWSASNGGNTLALGAVDVPIRLTNTVPTGGFLRIVISAVNMNPSA